MPWALNNDTSIGHQKEKSNVLFSFIDEACREGFDDSAKIATKRKKKLKDVFSGENGPNFGNESFLFW